MLLSKFVLISIRHSRISDYFWPRATLKGPKRSFVVVVLLGVESSSKNVPGNQICSWEQKNSWKQKIFVGREPKNFLGNFFFGNQKCSYKSKLSSQSPNCNGSKVAHYDIGFLCLPCMALCGLIWSYMVFYGLIWHFMVFNGRMSSFLAVIDPNSFVRIWGTSFEVQTKHE